MLLLALLSALAALAQGEKIVYDVATVCASPCCCFYDNLLTTEFERDGARGLHIESAQSGEACEGLLKFSHDVVPYPQGDVFEVERAENDFLRFEWRNSRKQLVAYKIKALGDDDDVPDNKKTCLIVGHRTAPVTALVVLLSSLVAAAATVFLSLRWCKNDANRNADALLSYDDA
ncbi:MAG: hypothetical protein MHM6MM_003220 [Cercozoa sp. M6MM]